MATEIEATSPLDRYECRACGYIYEPDQGDSRRQVPAGTPFSDVPDAWACPVCGATAAKFKNIGLKEAPSGFEENLKYGFGVNSLTPSQKNLVIFGVFGLMILFLLSFYGLG